MKRSRGVADVVESLISSLKEAGSKKKRDADRKYLKMDERQDRHAIQNYGVTVPQTVQILKNWMKENKGSFVATEVATQLWDWKDDHDKPVFEHRLAAIKLLRFSNSTLSALDFPLLDKCVNESGTWALIDEICTHVAPFVIYKLEYPEDQLFKWSVHENFWVRRSCLLTHLLALRQGDTSRFESFCKYAIPMIPEKEFFIQKAIGWVLRETAQKNPNLVFKFTLEHGNQMSTVTYKEATRKLSKADQQKLAKAKSKQ